MLWLSEYKIKKKKKKSRCFKPVRVWAGVAIFQLGLGPSTLNHVPEETQIGCWRIHPLLFSFCKLEGRAVEFVEFPSASKSHPIMAKASGDVTNRLLTGDTAMLVPCRSSLLTHSVMRNVLRTDCFFARSRDGFRILRHWSELAL